MDGETVPARWIRESSAYDVHADLERIRCRTLIVGGTKDLLYPPPAPVVLARIPGLVTVRIILGG